MTGQATALPSVSKATIVPPVSKANIVPPVSVASYPVLPPIKPLSGPFSPPEWSVAPLAVKYLEVSREGKTVNRIALDKRTHIVGTHVSCDTVCEHASLSRCVDMPLYSR